MGHWISGHVLVFGGDESWGEVEVEARIWVR